MKIVSVQFNGVGQTYSYIYDLDAEVVVGDYVVVDSPYNGIVTAKVYSVTESETDGKAVKYVVDIVDLTEYTKKQAARARAAEIRKQLTKKAKAFEESFIHRMLAAEDSEAAALVAELKNIKL